MPEERDASLVHEIIKQSKITGGKIEQGETKEEA